MTEETAPQGAQPDADKAKAAVEETKGPKTVKFRGLKLDLPAELPGEILFDLGDLEDGQKELAPILGVVRSLIGPEQYQQIREKVREDGIGIEAVGDSLGDLLNGALALYGLELGESSASQDS